MKTINNIYDQVCSFENMHLAYLKARKSKRYKKDVLSFSFSLEDNLFQLKKELDSETYIPGEYKEFIVCDSKKRLIKAPSFRDRVVHHALCNIIEPIFDQSFIYDSYACRKGKGSHLAIKRLKSFIKKDKEIYCLKRDISKYFDSINHSILLSLIKRKIKDRKTIDLISKIIASSSSSIKGVGIPIGNLTSQLFANIYLNHFDQFMKHGLREGMYLRYMDDFLILNHKKDLHFISKKTTHFLNHYLELEINPKKDHIFPALKGIDFVGYIVFQSHILLRKSTVKRFLKKNNNAIAFYSYAKHADAHLLTKSLELA